MTTPKWAHCALYLSSFEIVYNFSNTTLCWHCFCYRFQYVCTMCIFIECSLNYKAKCMLCINYTIFLFSTLLRFEYSISNLFDNLIKLYTVFIISTLLRFVRTEGDSRLNLHSFTWTSLYFRISVKGDLRQSCDIYVTTWVTTFLSLLFNL